MWNQHGQMDSTLLWTERTRVQLQRTANFFQLIACLSVSVSSVFTSRCFCLGWMVSVMLFRKKERDRRHAWDRWRRVCVTERGCVKEREIDEGECVWQREGVRRRGGEREWSNGWKEAAAKKNLNTDNFHRSV